MALFDGKAVFRRCGEAILENMRRVAGLVLGAPVADSGHGLNAEEGKLKSSWAHHRAEWLEEYLVSGYQDPRINAQSILARHFFVTELFGDKFDQLQEEELAFCVQLNEELRQRASALGVRMRAFTSPKKRAPVDKVHEVIADRIDTYEKRWRSELAAEQTGRLSVLEFACGSANDYRSLAAYGIAGHLDYRGVDLNDKNIANARRRFPDTSFEVGSVLDLPDLDGSRDFVLAFDIFEHLSLDAMHQAMNEAVRIAKRGVVLSFFNMSERPDHKSKPVRDYHRSELSAPRIEQLLKGHFRDVKTIHVKTFLKSKYGYEHSYNARAFTLIARDPA